MKNKILKSLLVALIVVPSVSLAGFSINDGLDKVSSTARTTANIADNAQNITEPNLNETNAEAQKYAASKIDQSTNGALSKTKETSDNLNQTHNDLKNTGKSMSKLFS